MTEKPPITIDLLLKAAGLVAAVSVAWAVMDSRGQAAQKSIDDHEIRLRNLERSQHELRQDYLTGLMTITGDLGVVISRLTSIEKAVKQ